MLWLMFQPIDCRNLAFRILSMKKRGLRHECNAEIGFDGDDVDTMFATQGSGEYLSAVRVDIQDSHHEPVLTAQSKGSWFFAQLPPGNYTVEVTPVAGHTGVNQSQRKDFHIADSGQSRFDFYWQKAQ